MNSVGGAQTWAPTGTTKAATSDPTADPLGQWNAGFPSIRNAETQTLALPNTFQAVIIDTPVASGSVHSPYKQPAGARLVRGALTTAYGRPPQPSPVWLSISKDGSSVVVTLGGLAGGKVETRAPLGFEILGSDQVHRWQHSPLPRGWDPNIIVGN